MLWTLAVIADSARSVYETFVRELSDAEREELWQDYVLFGELFGMSRGAMPASHTEFTAWLGSRLGAPDLQPTSHAVATAPDLAFEQPGPLIGRPILYFNNLMIKGTIPEQIRGIFSIRWTPFHRIAFFWAARLNRGLNRVLPKGVKRGRNDRILDAVIRAEERRGGTVVDPLG